jgi:hypothetical protein
MFVKNSLTLKNANNNYTTAHAKTAILDSGCTSHFITKNAPCKITKENKPFQSPPLLGILRTKLVHGY